MVEDALKSARNLERLLLLACLVALVFLSSLEEPHELEHQLAAVKAFRNLGSSDYADFVDRAIQAHLDREPAALWHGEKHPAPPFQPDYLAAQIRATWERFAGEQGFRITGAEELAAALLRPVHVGRLLPEELLFGSGEATLNDLEEQVRRLQVDRDAEVLFALPVACASQVLHSASADARTYVEPPSGGLDFRISAIRFELQGQRVGPDSFLHAPRNAVVDFSFELAPAGALPNGHRERVPVVLVTVPDSSWLHFLDEEPGPTASGDWTGLDSVIIDPNRPLASLQSDLEASLAAARAENRTIDLAGVVVPGSMALFGIPLVLVGLALSLLLHVQHLHRLSAAHAPTFREFAWTPLAPGGLWRWQMGAFVLVLPVGVELFLLTRSSFFDVGPSTSVPGIAVGILASAIFGIAILRCMGSLRRKLHSA